MRTITNSGVLRGTSGLLGWRMGTRNLQSGGGGGGPSGPYVEFASHITPMLQAIKDASLYRTHIGWHGMSIIAGIGSTDDTTSTFTPVWRTGSVVPTTCAALNTAQGGTQSYGVELIGAGTLGNAFYTLGGGAALQAEYNAVGGSGVFVSLAGAGSGTISFTVDGYAGQVCRVYAYLSGGSGLVTPRYSISGANTVSTTNLPTGLGTDVTPSGSSWWYTADITLANAGTSTVTLRASTTSGHNFNVYMVDADYLTTPGITLHRMGYSGKGVGNMLARSLDATDTQPAGNWIGADGSANGNRRLTQFASLTYKGGISGAFVSFDVNDIQHWNTYGWTLATHQRHYNNVVAAYDAIGMPALFVTGLSLRDPSNYTGSPAYNQADIIAAIRTAVSGSTHCAMLDLYNNWAGADNAARYAAQIADTSWWNAIESPHYLHPSLAGHQGFANLVATAVLAALP